jgi:4-carboxymuconolactone decarboxylase
MTNETAARIEPMMPPAWDAAAQDVMSMLPHGRDNILAAWRSGKPNVGTNLVCTQLRHAALAKAFLTFNAHFFYSSKLPPRTREILILRIAWLRRAEYEFIAHVDLGKRAGLTDADIECIEQGPDAAGLASGDANLLRAVDELKSDARISETTWSALVAQPLDTEQLIELVFIVGCYETLAMALNSFNVQLESISPGLDPATRKRLENQ